MRVRLQPFKLKRFIVQFKRMTGSGCSISYKKNNFTLSTLFLGEEIKNKSTTRILLTEKKTQKCVKQVKCRKVENFKIKICIWRETD